ncbi:ATP-grasp fold amidoligase family protein [Mycobacterium sp. C31M]
MPLLTYRATPPWLLPARRRLVSLIPVRILRQLLFLAVIRRWGDFAEPESLSEKVNWRILNDRRERIVRACDKLWMKEMARAAYPGPDLHIPQTYWSGTDLRDAPDLTTLPPWVLKPNHGSGHAVFGPEPQADLARLTRQTRNWLAESPLELGEWGYGRARRKLLLEQRIPTSDGTPPVDYKFLVFHGRVGVIQVNRGRFSAARTTTLLDADWQPLPARWRDHPVADEPRPAELGKMLEIAVALAVGWDFVRIDLYAVDGQVWFGEYTPYPGSGLRAFTPTSFDRAQGKLWDLPAWAQVQPGCA